MRTDVTTLSTLLFRLAHELSEEVMALSALPRIRQRRFVQMNLEDQAVSALAHIAGAQVPLRGNYFDRLEALGSLAGARNNYGTLKKLLRSAMSRGDIDEDRGHKLITKTDEIVALCMALTIETRRVTFSRAG